MKWGLLLNHQNVDSYNMKATIKIREKVEKKSSSVYEAVFERFMNRSSEVYTDIVNNIIEKKS